jgi:hypothetical protein
MKKIEGLIDIEKYNDVGGDRGGSKYERLIWCEVMIASLTLALTASVPAHATTLQELLGECVSERGSALALHCVGYIGGIGVVRPPAA